MKVDLFEGATLGLSKKYTGRPIDWIKENVRVPHSARATELDPHMTPWLIQPFEAFADSKITQLCIRACTGGGKTTFLEAMVVPWVIAQDPGPMLLAGQNDDMVSQWAETRLYPVLQACEPVRKLFPKDRHAKRKTAIIFPHMQLSLAGANLSSLQELSMRYCYGDEVWTWRPGMISFLKKRHHDRWNRKTILCSQGYDSGHEMEGEFDSGLIHEWGVVCENCQQWHKMLWTSIRYDEVKLDDDKWDWAKLENSVRHVCPHCEHETKDTTEARRAMSQRGFYKQQPSSAIKGHASFTFSALAVWWIPWASLAVEWVKAQEAKKRADLSLLKNFIQQRLAEVWTTSDQAPQVTLQAGQYLLKEYANGEKVDGEAMRFLTVDCQKDHYWAACRAWKPDGSSRLVWAGRLFELKDIQFLQQTLKVHPYFVFMDAGFFTQRVYTDCAANGYTALHGSGSLTWPWSKKGKTVYKFFSEKRFGMGSAGVPCQYYVWSNEAIKDCLIGLRSQGPPHWEFGEDVSEAYLFQLNSEVKREVVDKKTKRPVMRWVSFRDNHLWDCEAMQVTAAMLMGVLANGEGIDKGAEA